MFQPHRQIPCSPVLAPSSRSPQRCHPERSRDVAVLPFLGARDAVRGICCSPLPNPILAAHIRTVRRRFRAAFGANVHVIAKPHFPRGNFRLRMKAESLAVHDEAHIRANFAVSPKIERFLDNQIADAIISLDQPGNFRGGFGGSNVFLRLRRRREKAHGAARPAKARR